MKSLFSSTGESEILSIAHPLATLLSSQISLCKHSSKLNDKWAIGYIGGFTIAALHTKGFDCDEKGLHCMAATFELLFGRGRGVDYLRLFSDVQEEKGQAAIDGESEGQRDAFDLLEGRITSAIGLLKYCHSKAIHLQQPDSQQTEHEGKTVSLRDKASNDASDLSKWNTALIQECMNKLVELGFRVDSDIDGSFKITTPAKKKIKIQGIEGLRTLTIKTLNRLSSAGQE